MKKIILGVATLSLISATHFSCKKDKFSPITQSEPGNQVVTQINLEQQTVLGKKLKNPFAIENMRAAYTELTGYRSSNLEPNKLYVRFLPKNVDERMSLEGRDLIFETVPIDREIDSYGDFYQDPETEHLGTTWIYTTVDLDFSFNNVEYQILDSLFLTDKAEDNRTDIGVDLVLL
jgi:hypothetical protein